MSDINEQIESIEKEIRETPYHKGTEHHIGKLRARIAKLKDKLLESSFKLKGGGGGGYAVKKQGDATIVLVGPPSAGKSTLINKLTNAKSKVAPYAFTTVTVIPGMMEYKNSRIQILDVPGLIEGAREGKGRGKEVISVVRGADLLIVMSDTKRPEYHSKLIDELEKSGVRVNKQKPKIRLEKATEGGIILHSNIKQDLSSETIKDIASELGFRNGEVILHEKISIEGLIDALSPNRVYIPALHIINKRDQGYKEENEILYISAEKSYGLIELKEKIWEDLGFTRVYLVRPDEEPSFNNPLVVRKNYTLSMVAQEIGTDFAEMRKKAKIWGSGSKFPGQEVSLETKVEEGMQVRFV